MKRFLLLLIAVFSFQTFLAKSLTPDEARQRITRYMQPRKIGAFAKQQRVTMQLVATSYYIETPDNSAVSYYVFNVSDGNGYFVASADDRLPAVLGYSNEGNFDINSIPENMKAWLREYDRQIEYFCAHPEVLAATTVIGEPVSPLLKDIEWGQDAPFNNLCPMDGDERSITGCVATAMAQIMYYWKYPQQSTKEIPEYTTKTRGFTMSAIAAGTKIDWENILPQYKGISTNEQNKAVANLMLMCGTAVNMDYRAEASSAGFAKISTALLEYFDFDSGMTSVSRSKFKQADWNQMIYNELAEGRPVLYDGNRLSSGHAFLVDGYSTDDFFHLNWGWNGNHNGYFLLSVLDPYATNDLGITSSNTGYSSGQDALIGVQPNKGTELSEEVVLSTRTISLGDLTDTFDRSDTNSDFVVSVFAEFRNYTKNTYTFDYTFGLFDKNDNFIKEITEVFTIQLDPTWGYGSRNLYVSFGKGIASGTYKIKPISRQNGTSTWLPNKGTDVNYLKVVINGNKAVVTMPTFKISGTIETTGNIKAGLPVPLQLTVTNEGSEFNRLIHLYIDDQFQGSRYLDLAEGETKTISIYFTPETSGTKNVRFDWVGDWDKEKEEYIMTTFASEVLEIEEKPVIKLRFNSEKVLNATSRTINDKTIQLRIPVDNLSDDDYNDDFRVTLWKEVDNAYVFVNNYYETANIPAHTSKDVAFDLDVTESACYTCVIHYKELANWTKAYQTEWYTVNVPETSGILNIENASSSTDVMIYTTNGAYICTVKQAKAQIVLKSLPKGVYLLKTADETKVIRQ